MKTWIAAAAALICGSLIANAADIAVITFRQGKQKVPVTVELYDNVAPRTVANFKQLAKKGYYKKTAIHRAFPNYLVQMGDPLSRGKRRDNVGTGGPGYTLPPELGGKVLAGSLVTARLPDKINPARLSNGSQFFVALQPISSFSGRYTVFGRVTSGLDFLQSISNKPVDTNDYPLERVTIDSIVINPKS